MSRIKEHYHDEIEKGMRQAKTKGIFIRIDRELLIRLDLSARALGIKTNELMRLLIIKHLKNYKDD